MVAVGGMKQMVSLSPENVNDSRASFRNFGFNACTMFLAPALFCDGTRHRFCRETGKEHRREEGIEARLKRLITC